MQAVLNLYTHYLNISLCKKDFYAPHTPDQIRTGVAGSKVLHD